MGEKKTTFFERLELIVKHYRINSVNEMALKHLKYKASQKLNRLKDPANDPSVEIIRDLLAKWPEISAKWLLIGEGEMICGNSNSDLSNKIERPESMESSLTSIKRDLKKVLNHQVKARAEIRGFGEYQVMKDAKNDDHRRIAIMAQISKLIDANLEDGEIVDIAP